MTENSVVIERTFAAPIDTVWAMWTDSDHFSEWYGPTGASIPVAKMDVQVGGSRLICMEMQTPDGPKQMWFSDSKRSRRRPTRISCGRTLSS